MKPTLSVIPILVTGILFSSCFSGTTDRTTYKMTYGAPKAYITKDAIPATTTDGPIAYAPNIPPLVESDSVVIRVDVQHKKITVANLSN